MAKKLKSKEFHFSLGVLFRWVIFALLIYFSINYLSGSKSSLNPNLNSNLDVLGIKDEPVIIKATQTFDGYKKQVIDFVNQQIVDIKKQIVTEVYQGVIKSIDTNKQ